ncbi:MAG: mannitol-1-phosphate 5-dehydrogenase [Candidatus Hydrogenedentota bacterium]
MKQAVHFGAGNIGRGFLGQLYFESGYHTTFIDVSDDLVEGLNKHGGYPLRIVGDDIREVSIGECSAIHGRDFDAVAAALAQTDLASTAVGQAALPHIAPLIARGIQRRFSDDRAAPLNVIICENLLDAANVVRQMIRAHLPEAWHATLDSHVGLVEASIGRMVPIMTMEQRAESPLLVCVEPYCELPVDANGFKGDIPPLNHLKPQENFTAYVERKLFVHNAGHACAAYLGYLRGHEYIWQAMGDGAVRREVEKAMHESCLGLHARHGMDLSALTEHAADLIHRFQNKALGDQVLRVAADPVRKLGPKDRLIGACHMCLDQNVEPRSLAFAAAAAMRYDPPSDKAAEMVQRIFHESHMDGVMREVCRVSADSPLGRLIAEQHNRLSREGWLRKKA